MNSMKKNFKLVLALVLSVMMIMGSVAAMAEDPAPAYDGKVSVTALAKGDVAHFYKVVGWVGEASGNVKGWNVVSPFNFDLNAVLVGTPADNTANPPVAAVAATGITAALANTLAATPNKVEAGSDTVGDDGIAELDVTGTGKGPGLYMVLITPANPDVVYNPVFVSSDYNVNANPDTDTWAISEVASYSDTAAAKKSTTTLTKTASTVESDPDDVKWITTAIGDTVHFTVTTTIPGFGPAFIDPFFKMTDKLTDLTLVSGSVKVTSPADAKAAAHIVEGTDQYSIDWNETAGKAYLATVDTPTLVTVEYDAKVATTAPYNINREKNEVWTEFSHDINNTSDHSFKKDDTVHYTFTIDADVIAGTEESEGIKGSEIVKVGRKADGTPINETKNYSKITKTESWEGPQAEAHFKLYRDDACTQEYIPNGASTGLDIVSGADGRMKIAGLDAGKYWLKEVSCPAGFVMDTHVAAIVISTVESEKDVTEYTKDGITWISAEAYNDLQDKSGYKSYSYKVPTIDSYTITINGVKTAEYHFENNGTESKIKWTVNPPEEKPHQFINNEGLQLPSTGGIGTTIFYIAGSLLVLAAAILLITKRRMSSND